MKKMRFCPGYDVARTCNGRCATCKDVVVQDEDEPPPGHLVMLQALCECLDFPYPQRRRRGRLPVMGRVVVEEFKVIRPGKDAQP